MKRFPISFRVLFYISVATLISGCATGYHARGFAGGYSEIITSSDSYIVTFRGNGYTSSEKVMKYSLRRASELTLQNGYKYFAVVSSTDQTKTSLHSSSSGYTSGAVNSYRYSNSTNTCYNGTVFSSSHAEIISKPGISMGIKCYKNKPFFTDVIDAEYYLKNNSG